jgi:hypothetical protein
MTTKECAKILEAAGMVEVAREGRNLTGIRILDRERFNRTLATGYVQWPELRPMPMEERGGGRRQRLFKGAIQK